MRIVGIDPGSKITGYGFIDTQGPKVKILEVGTIQPKYKDPLHVRNNKIYSCLKDLIEEFRPDVLVLEKLYAHYKHPATAIILGHVRGVICLLCAQCDIELAEYSVKRIRKALTGNGNSTKDQTRSVVAHTLNIDEKKLTLDASDALALALGHAQLNRVMS